MKPRRAPTVKPVLGPLTVHHFGPDPAYVGGMGSVIRVLTEYRVGADEARSHITWRPDAKFGSLSLVFGAALGMLRLPKSATVHIHLAHKGSFIREGALVGLGRSRGMVTAATIHGSSFLSFGHRHPWLVATVLSRAHIITCLDEDVLEFVRRLVPQARVELMPNPVPMDSDSRCADTTEEIVVFAGEIGSRKGVDVLCRAWPRVLEARPEAKCVLIGPVKDFEMPRLERLEVRAPADTQIVRELLRTARVVALPSRAEGMPMILTEAMSGGRPFVSTPVGGIPELAAAGGVLVPVGDDASLAERLIEFLADPHLAGEIGEQGRQFCSATRSVEVVGRTLRELYRTAEREPAVTDAFS
jgi:glycosyltransferase involved in cell wall biosynthesis